MKLLTFSTLYPNSSNPQHGIFTETSLQYLLQRPGVQSRVVAPVPWFPFTGRCFGRYAAFARCTRSRQANGLTILHPRFPTIPKFNQSMSPIMLATAMIPILRGVIASGYDFDIIDAHYFYPDGVAAAMLGRYFKKPVTIKALGSDINVLGRHHRARRDILWAARQAIGVSAVSTALKESLIDLGVDRRKVVVLRNGVNLDLFRPLDRHALRMRLGIAGFTLLSVGNLVESKGHHLAIDLLRLLPDVRLIIAGAGEELGNLQAQARRLEVDTRVLFAGSVLQQELVEYYNVADVLISASRREGWANVLLEAMACGTPVVATAIPGTMEAIGGYSGNVLFPERTTEKLFEAVQALRNNYPLRQKSRLFAEQFSWDAPTSDQIALYQQVLQS